MIIIALDDEALSLEGLTLAIKSASPDSSVHSFQSAEKALAFARETRPDVIFLDIEMRGMSGLEAAAHLQKMHPQVNIIFTTGYQEYMSEAFRLHVSGYITKPITPAKVQTELEHLRFPAADSSRSRIVITNVGDFKIFADDHPITFGYAKARELETVQEQIRRVPLYQALQSARKQFSGMMAQVNAELSSVLNPNGSQGGCSGNCSACNGCG